MLAPVDSSSSSRPVPFLRTGIICFTHSGLSVLLDGLHCVPLRNGAQTRSTTPPDYVEANDPEMMLLNRA
jgi:hypothetical protein